MSSVPVTLTVLAVAFLLRFSFRWFLPHSAGVDHWYWKSYIETYKTQRRFPPVLPHYLLDEHQWYPPLFPLLMAQIPDSLYEKFESLSAVGIDLLRMCILLATAHQLSHGDSHVIIVSGLVYATTPILISYNFQMNPRGLGALILDMGILAVVWGMILEESWLMWGLALPLFSLVLLTHKMTTQLLWYLLISAGILSRKLEFTLLLLGSILVAIILSKGFYLKVLKAHWDIVSFWARESPRMGAHPIKESPLYGDPSYVTPSKTFAPGWRNLLKRIVALLFGGYSPTTAVAVGFTYLLEPQTPWENWVGIWVTLVFSFSFLTVVFPWLRGLGYGNLYLYNAAFPTALYLGLVFQKLEPWMVTVLTCFIVLNLFAVGVSFVKHKTHRGLTLSDSILDKIKELGPGAWLCIPFQLNEHVACLANRTVLWGAHGFGFRQLRQVYPVITVRFPDLVKNYGLKYLLLDSTFLPDLNRLDIKTEEKFSSCGLHILEVVK